MDLKQASTVLSSVFGYSQFKDKQSEIIQSILDGHDTFVIMPTGGGKSVCYQIPAILFSSPTIVISPLISLMKDQVDQLSLIGVKANYLHSELSNEQEYSIINDYKSNSIKILYVSPERFVIQSFIALITQYKPSLIAIDEAHCISQWGHNFRPDYLALSNIKSLFNDIPLIALTATADRLTQTDIINKLSIGAGKQFISSFDRPNIRYNVTTKFSQLNQIIRCLQWHKNESGIIYCLSRRSCETLSEQLNTKGYRTFFYHAGLSNEQRTHVHDIFIKEENVIVVATIAFGMGINKSNVRFIIHANAPRSIENYYQETGRAGRDGLPAISYLFYSNDEFNWYEQLVSEKQDTEYTHHEHKKFISMKEYSMSSLCRRRFLLNYFDEQTNTNCGNCDNCLNPVKTYDALNDVQMILSTILRTGQRFGEGYIIDMLKASKKQKIIENRHDSLSVYGIGKSKTIDHWKYVIRQLIQLGYLKKESTQFNALIIMEPSRDLLLGKKSIQLPINNDDLSQTQYLSDGKLTFEERNLFAQLKHCRKRLSEQLKMPAHYIFNDATLIEMVRKLPLTREDMFKISGVGEYKMEHYGTDFILLIKKYMK